MFEIHRDKRDGVWDGNARFAQPIELPALRRRVIDFKNPQLAMGAAKGKGIETGAEHNVLRNTLGKSDFELIFGISAARREKRTQSAGPRILLLVKLLLQQQSGFRADHFQCKWIVMDARLIEELMSGASDGDTVGGPAELTLLHKFPISQEGRTRRFDFI